MTATFLIILKTENYTGDLCCKEPDFNPLQSSVTLPGMANEPMFVS